MSEISEINVKKVDSGIGTHSFTVTVAEKLIKFEVLKFKDSIFLWIGDKRTRNFGDLSLALMSRNEQPVCTKIMGPQTDLTSNNLAIKLSKKLGKPVYVSFNLTEDRLTVPVVTKRIVEEIKNHPNYF